MTIPDPPVAVREALVADAAPLARCQLACWAEAYAGLVDQAQLDEVVAAVAERTERWQRILADFPGRPVAEQDGEVVGFAAPGPSRDPDAGPGLELYALYVRQRLWGSGTGHRLLAAAVGDAAASLWVFRDNARARRFYAAHGFVPDGQEKLEPYFERPKIRMVRPQQ